MSKTYKILNPFLDDYVRILRDLSKSEAKSRITIKSKTNRYNYAKHNTENIQNIRIARLKTFRM